MTSSGNAEQVARPDSRGLEISGRNESPRLHMHHRLAQWSISNGGFLHEDVEMAYAPNRGFFARVVDKKSILAGTRIASCPMSITMSVLNALDIAPFSSHGSQFPASFLDRYRFDTDILQAFFLMEQYSLKDKSWWAPYIATLPTVASINDLQFDSEEDVTWIKGTNLHGAIVQQQQKWHEQFRQALQILKDLNWQSAVQDKYSWQLYRWAATIYGSRSFTSQVLSDTTPADKARPLGSQEADHPMLSRLFSERFAVLLPLMDILNHKPAARVEWKHAADFVGLEILSEYTSGSEIFNNYGPRDNEGLLMSYGFVLDDNPYDHHLLSIPALPGSPLEASRSWPPDERSNENYNCFIFDINHPIVECAHYLERALFSYDLFDSISVLCGNDRELQHMHKNQQTLMSSAFPAGFDDFRNMLATLGQVMLDSLARMARTQAYDPVQIDPSVRPRTQKQKNAQIYRQKQIEILQSAASVCAFILVHACSDQQTSDLLLTMQSKMPEYCSRDVEELVTKKPCLTTQNELLTSAGLIELLPSPTDTAIRSLCQEVVSNIPQSAEGYGSYIDTAKSRLALIFAAMCDDFQSGVELPPRLRAWCTELTQSYPPEDENWSYVPPPGPWEPGEDPPMSLMNLLDSAEEISTKSAPDSNTRRWLEPKKICWGWNVMEEEGVRVPSIIERFVSDEPEQMTGPMGFLIYCKQY